MSGFVPSTLASENWPFSLEWLPQPAYMVGGAVRDAMLGRSREYLDLDFVIPSDAVKVARTIAHRYQAGFVLLDPVRRIARVVFPQATADFAQQEGDSLETDLHRRDFTVNAIAYNPHTQEIIDPLNGYADLQAGVLRMIAKANLKDDPLRLLRAYRQAAQLGFTIEPTTQAAIRDLASHLCQVAAERVRVEIGYLLASPQGHTWMAIAENDGLLKQFFPNTTPESFRKLAVVDEVADLLAKQWPQLGVELQGYVRETVKTTWLSIAKLACLVHPDPSVAEIELQKLTYSRAEIRAVTTAVKLFPQLKTANTLREQYFVFQEAGMVFAAIAVLALVQDILVEAMSGDNRLSAYSPLITRYLNPDDLVAHPTQLVSGKNLMIALDLPPSPLVGELLTEIAIARIEGKVTTTEAAIAFARQLLEG
ncbi:CCA tRNA nucleotidyltransferase [Anabaena sp. FACHB-709]|uniref:PolyA polymerase n=2 Tax=Nostocaceae TaxID=1162 RepID=A0A1Z4KIF7_ANAVA|nr:MULTISPECIES: CCA tRNA nucleotidyltransferase [Nostocaceae]BAY68760.1 polyA polymerase [Trichormus variabilis NIES-23]HBW33596.1 CCA tRNA nucleotidyltransferase [Nostoc sp. UBA8866]MBD2170338.1 CCA tRNA nucleotidyltransferase [Anabaena cylindrica FACHB-318]MBD2262183.1 CCA tRNA nucleotidyltransferase [Anabaena sp. FACHB-709]MBD2271671.1 CCA tRNA nucleotidyltransferase [Nostoc sp. PCC 7120 = FACHB-418]